MSEPSEPRGVLVIAPAPFPMRSPLSTSACTDTREATALLSRTRHLLLDLDGTLILQDETVEGATELLSRFDGRFAIVSNNSTHTAASMALRLRRMGLRVPSARIVLAGETAVRLVCREFPGARVMLIGSQAIRRFALAQGCRLAETEVDVVLLALDMRFSYQRLSAIVHALQQGARLVVANGDLTHPGPNGTRVPETGSLLASVRAASGTDPLLVVGKPAPLLFEEGLRQLGAAPDDVVVLGDNPATDGDGAARLGLPCILVGPVGGATPTLAALLDRLTSPSVSVRPHGAAGYLAAEDAAQAGCVNSA